MTTNTFKESILDDEEFGVTWEHVPGRGAREQQQDAVFEAAEIASEGDVVDGISVTENAGGNPAISAEYLGMKLQDLDVDPLVHFTAKDKNRNQLESLLYAMDREGIQNLLVMTGDYQNDGYQGQSRPVYDLDPVQIMDLISDLNEGLEYTDKFGREKSLEPTDFFAGVAVSPFKRLESELVPQYWKLEKKIEQGARFVIPQVGYDARKFHELLQYVEDHDLDVPVIGNIYVLDPGSANAMNKNRIPGVIVTDDLLEDIETEAEENDDDGKQARLERAAKMYAFMKGMGYDGVHIAGHEVDHDGVEYVVERGEELVPEWREIVEEFDYPMEDGFYYYERDPETGLNTWERTTLPEQPKQSLTYRGFKVMHDQLFEPDGALFGPMRWSAKKVDGSRLEEPYQMTERMVKTASNDCQECGNCALLDLAYQCPMSQCPKSQRNGPCGGSYDGWCEVHPEEQKCIYVKAYRELKADGGPEKAREKLRELYIPPPDWELENTSSWLNYFLGRDYASKNAGIEPPTSGD
ncbi:methylenetetrahydrofolate reductase (NADPH) [Halalkaliarchaeum desulfuricum]|uniref:Methylenetetrahydrofolate reductase (NADPH) n=1 Tax=Halalkaliarchaeum desulfuricum TaxID=2055893 RepID=A0A343TL19_9EURY|nr:methylenetetrahydrofolate reductase C-terminal domain-containing protein [Halalkaliarchaeum desulfuricum]AUX09791.1 methylenetetrahydrofolate reductase (NADPH) [Halalkaliarchaeum desulfuricum]